MPYLALARKWRPRNFDEVVGQEHVVKALRHALEFDRTHHAYLFAGTRGVGKTTIARILAKALNCESRIGYNPCGNCASCLDLDEGRFVDLIEVDAASRTKVEDTRELLENVQYAPSCGRFKVYLIDEVHMLSNHSFNALLKTLEEPPHHVKFLLATTDPQKLPVTVLSRCLQFTLKHLTSDQITEQLEHISASENIDYEASALRALSRAAAGSLRDALSLMDQAIVHGGGRLIESDVSTMLGTVTQTPVFDLLEAVADHDATAALKRVAEIACHSPDFGDVLQQVLSVLHHAALAQWNPNVVQREDQPERIVALATRLSAEELQLFYQIALIGQRDLPLATDPRSGFEMVTLRMLAFRPADDSPARTQRSESPAVDAAPAAKPTTPARTTPEQPAHKPGPQPAGPAATAGGADAADWVATIEAMGLTGMARELASHCVIRSSEGDTLQLVLGRQQAHLRTAQVERSLADALNRHFRKPLRLSISVEGQVDDTPAIRQERARAERQRLAEQAIEQDEQVKAFKELFDAEIVSGSTHPLD